MILAQINKCKLFVSEIDEFQNIVHNKLYNQLENEVARVKFFVFIPLS